MEFPKQITIEACEQFLSELVKKAEVDSQILLPVGTSKYAFGGLASAIQTINSWARRCHERQLVLRSAEAANEIEELIKRPHKFTAAMYAKSITLSESPLANIRAEVNIQAKDAIANQSKSRFGQQHGSLCWFCFVDHSTKGFDRSFYIQKQNSMPEPRQPAQFQTVIDSMIKQSLAASGGVKELNSSDLEDLGRIFYELFLNTHEHGTRSEVRSEWIKPGVRVIYTHGINFTEKGLTNISEKQPRLSKYLNSVSKKHHSDKQKRFIEISIIDAGLGYCHRWLADHPSEREDLNISIKAEYDIFKKCFTFRQSSTGEYNKGHGLAAVMDRLTKLDGFMHVRSGRLSLYRDFIETPYLTDKSCTFSDWGSAQSADYKITPMPEATGVAITLLIPLGAK